MSYTPPDEQRITLPLERLPISPSARHAMLRHYFCDKDAFATQTPDGWDLKLFWPGGVSRHVDPELDEGLAWWGTGVERSMMAREWRRSGRVLQALYDSWTLYGWSQWLKQRVAGMPERLIVLHIDDHRDIGSPRLFMNGSDLIDSITGAPVSLTRPETVKDAILSGAIGMGSFLTPFLHAARHTEVRHLCQAPKALGTADYRIDFVEEKDTLLLPGASRPAIRLVPSNSGPAPGQYRLTNCVKPWLEDIPLDENVAVLLHMDLDFFNNRYDGDSDWPQRSDSLNPPLNAVLRHVDHTMTALAESQLFSRIEDISIAYSPGFFPGEMWAPVGSRIEKFLRHLNASNP